MMNRVTDYDNFIKNGSLKRELSEDLRDELINIENLIKTSLNKTSGQLHNSGICCNDLNIGKNCAGTIFIKRTDIPHKLIWECSICTSAGEILNWRQSPSYKKYIKIKENSRTLPSFELTLSKFFYFEFKELCSTKLGFYIIISSAVEKNNCFYINIAEFDMLRILEFISEKISSNSPDKARFSKLRYALVDSYSPVRAAFY